MADTIGTAYIQIEPNAKGIENKISDAISGGTASYGSALGGALGTAAKVGTAALGAAMTAAGAFAKSAVDAGMNFDSSMSQVYATMGDKANKMIEYNGQTMSSMEALRDFAQEMGRTTAFSASESADALNYMALAGYDAETSMAMLPNVLNLASAGSIDLARASDMVTDAQTALGLSIEETGVMVDQMAAASSNSNTSVEQLGEAFLKIGANARDLSGGTTELSTVLGVLADNGIKGSEAGTHLRNIMLSMTPTTDKAAAAWEQLGVSAYDASGQLRDLPTVFGELNAAMDGMTDQEKTETLSAMFNKTDLASIKALLGTTADRYDELSAAIENSDKAAKEMADTQLNNLAGDMTLFQSALEGAQIAISDALTPTLREFVRFGTDGLSKITGAFQEGGLSGAMEAFGEILSDGLNMVIRMLPDMVDAGLRLLEALGKGLLDNLDVIISAAVTIIEQLSLAFLDCLPQLAEGALQILLGLAQGFVEMAPVLIPKITEVVVQICQMLVDNLDLLIDAAIQIMIAIGQGLILAAPILIEKLPEIIMKLVSVIIEYGGMFLEAVGSILLQIGEFLLAKGAEFVSNIGQTCSNILTSIGEWLSQLPTTLAYWAGFAIGSFIKFFLELPSNLQQIWNNVVTGVTTFATQFMQKATESAHGFFNNLVNGIQTLPSRIRALGSQLVGALADLPSKFLEIGGNIVKGIWNGISEGWSWLVDSVKDLAGNLLQGAKDALGIESPSKAFRDSVGKWIPAGIASGIEQNMGVVDKAIRDMTDRALVTATSSGLSALSTNSAYSAQTMAGEGGTNYGGYNQTVNIYSPKALTASEVARQTRNATRNMVLALRGV